MIIKTVKVSEKGQIAIPIEIRADAEIKIGENLIIIEEKGKIILQKAPKIAAEIKEDFSDLLKHSEKVAEKLWSNKSDEIWDTL